MSSTLPPNEYIFNLIDTNGDGNIDSDELYAFMRNIYPDITEDDIENTISNIDSNGDGLISLSEFTSVISNDILPEDIENAYNALTLNGVENIESNIALFFELLKISSLYNIESDDYYNIIYRMVGTTLESFTELWNFLQSLSS